MIRKALFWTHLTCGVVAAIGVFTMAATGVLLTYELQIKEWVAETAYVPESEQVNRLSLEQLTASALEINPELVEGSIIVNEDAGAPVIFRQGRRGGLQLNPYTGAEMSPVAPWLNTLFSDITGLHRWFNFSSENRAIPRMIIDVSNLLFAFLIISGLYLWLPSVWTSAAFKTRLFFNAKAKTSKARDFVWHHVFGIWAAIPLLILVISGSMFSFRWTGDLIYAAFGTERPTAGAAASAELEPGLADRQAANFLSLDQLFLEAQNFSTDWRVITLSLPAVTEDSVDALIDRGNGKQPQLRETVTLDRRSGEMTNLATFEELPLNQRIRPINRYLHTGEYFGVFGQTIAGLVSFFAVIMVWTGVALSYRRLLQPLLRRRQKAEPLVETDPIQV